MISAHAHFLAAEARAWAGVARRERWIDSQVARARLRVLDHGSGPAVVFLHGITGTSSTWLPILSHLAGYRCLLVDFFGHGGSDDVDFSGVAIRPFVVDILTEVLDGLGVGRCAVVGNSMGGMFALWLAAARPERLDAVVAVGEPGAALPGVRARFPFWLLSTPLVNRVVLAAPPPLPVQRAYERVHHERLDAQTADIHEAEYWASRRRGRGESIASLSRTVVRTTRVLPEAELTAAEIDSWSVPTRFIWGEEAPLLAPDDARQTIDRMPSAELIVVPGGHIPQPEDPAARAALVRDFLAAHAGH